MAGGRREQAGRLVAPGRIERMLGDRQKLDMGEAEIGDIGDELAGEVVIAQELAVRAALPGAEMRLVDRHRRAARIALGAGLQIGGVRPLDVERPGDHGCRIGPQLRLEGHRIGLERLQIAVGADDLVLVDGADRQVGDEDLVDAGVGPPPHQMAAAVPLVEVADHRDALGVGRPHREMHAGHPLVHDGMGAELVEQPQVRALGDVIVVERAEHRAEGVGVEELPGAAGIAGAQPVADARAGPDRSFEHVVRRALLQRAQHRAGVIDHLDGVRTRYEGPHHARPPDLLQAQNGERVMMRARGNGGDIAGRESRAVARRGASTLGARARASSARASSAHEIPGHNPPGCVLFGQNA